MHIRLGGIAMDFAARTRSGGGRGVNYKLFCARVAFEGWPGRYDGCRGRIRSLEGRGRRNLRCNRAVENKEDRRGLSSSFDVRVGSSAMRFAWADGRRDTCGAKAKSTGVGVEVHEGSVMRCSDWERRNDAESHPYEHHSSHYQGRRCLFGRGLETRRSA